MLKESRLGDVTIRSAAGYVRVFTPEYPEGIPLGNMTTQQVADIIQYAYNEGANNTKNNIYNILRDAEYY